LVRRQGCR